MSILTKRNNVSWYFAWISAKAFNRFATATIFVSHLLRLSERHWLIAEI